MILKTETYNFHRLDLTRQLRLAATPTCATPAEAFAEARKIIDNGRGTEGLALQHGLVSKRPT